MPPPDVLLRPLSELPDPLPVPVLTRSGGAPAPFLARVRVPGSKSLTNRALLLAGLAEGRSVVRGALLEAHDTTYMLDALMRLGTTVHRSGEKLHIVGCAGRWTPKGPEVRLGLGNAGTAVRFLAAAAVLSPAPVVIDGNERMRERPIGELIGALEQIGVGAEYLGREGSPPVRLRPPERLPAGERVELGTTASSQFVSALLLIAPFLPGGLTLVLEGPITSRSYVSMTLGLLDQVGARVRASDDLRVIRVLGAEDERQAGRLPHGLKGFEYAVEPDASSATYFWAAAAIVPGATCRVAGLDGRSLQGDVGFPEVLARMGATVLREEGAEHSLGVRGPPPRGLEPVMADMSQMPDAALTLAAVASFARGRSVIRGLRTLRVKESDRIAGLQRELVKVGVKVEASVLGDADAITVQPPEGGIDCSGGCAAVELETYDDHRMAMALALIGLRRPNVMVRNPACVGKTFPGFWGTLAQLY